MRCALLLFGFALGSGACGREPAPAASAPPRPAPAVAQPSRPRAVASGCAARPETVYGQEPVVFELRAGEPTAVDVELRDLRGRTLAKGSVPAPGEWRAEDLPSGDFTLQVGAEGVSCVVTVNRELTRASEVTR